MKNDNLKIKCSKIEYDPETVPEGERLPKTMTVELDREFADCLVEGGVGSVESFMKSFGAGDAEEFRDAVWDEIEARTGASVTRCEFKFAL